MSSFPSLASLVHSLVKMKRTAHAKPDTPSRVTSHEGQLRPLPREISDKIPQELFERIIGFLHDDKNSLSRCSVVCWSWLPASRFHLLASLPVRSIQLNNGWSQQFNCSVPFGGGKYILYGNMQGVYWSEVGRNTMPVHVLSLPDVSQIDVLEKYNLLVCLSAHRVTTISLDMLNPFSPKDVASCTIVSSHVSCYKVGTLSRRTYICVVKSGGPKHTTFKLMVPIVSLPQKTYSLVLYKEFYVPEKATSVHFLRRKIVAALNNHGFEVIDVDTLDTQTLLDPAISAALHGQKSWKGLAIYRVDDEFMVCYNVCAIYVNRRGQLTRSERVQWTHPIEVTFFRDPYVLALSQSHIEVRHVRTGELLQTVWGSFRLLSTSPQLCMVQAEDARVLGLEFNN